MNFPHWHYCLAICDDLERTTRFEEISPDNFKTHSTEYTRLYLAAGSEIDVVAKLLCHKINPSAKTASMNDYRQTVLQKYPDLVTVSVVLRRYALNILPWKDWGMGTNPVWWTLYNKVKHERHLHYKDANLENTLNAVAGLLVLVGYCHREELAAYSLQPMPNLMTFDRKYHAGLILQGADRYVLPGIPKPKA